MSIQPVTKAAEHIWSIQHRYWKKKRKKKEKEKKRNKEKAVKASLIKNSVCVCVGGGGGGTITSSRKDWAEYYVTVHPM